MDRGWKIIMKNCLVLQQSASFLLYSQQPTHITYWSQTNPVHIIPYSLVILYAAALIPTSTPAKWRLLSKFSD
jgi:hypothetical protein